VAQVSGGWMSFLPPIKKHKALNGTQGTDHDQQESRSSLILTGFVQKTVCGFPDFLKEKSTCFQTFQGDFYLHVHQRNASKSTSHDKISQQRWVDIVFPNNNTISKF